MTKQSLISRAGARLLPLVATQAFPTAWIEAGDDQSALAAVARKRRRGDGPRPDALLKRRWKIATESVAGRDLSILTPKGGSTGKVLFHNHGGAYVFGPNGAEWISSAALARRIGADLAVYDYPKVPEHDCEATLATTVEAYELISARYQPEDILVSGVSAGGGLALSLLFQLLERAQPMPAGMLLISPWLDLSITHPGAKAMADTEKLLPLAVLRRDGELYAGTRDIADPLISPRFAGAEQLGALPPMLVAAGAHEVLLPEAREFVDKVVEAGGTADLHVEPFGPHAGTMLATPEAKPIRSAMVDAGRRWLA